MTKIKTDTREGEKTGTRKKKKHRRKREKRKKTDK